MNEDLERDDAHRANKTVVSANPYETPATSQSECTQATWVPRRKWFVLGTSFVCVVVWGLLLPALTPGRGSEDSRPDVWAETVHKTLCVFDSPLCNLGFRDPVRMPTNALTIAIWGASLGLLTHSLLVGFSKAIRHI